jgi:transposase-like protein
MKALKWRSGSVAFAKLVGWLHEILPTSAVSQTEVRTHRDHDLFQMVLPIFPELAGSRGTHGRAGLEGRSHFDLALGSGLRPQVYRQLHGEIKRKSPTWHMDETFVRITGKWMYLFRAVDSHGQTVDFYLSETRDREAAKQFLEKALANPDNRVPHVFARDGLRSYPAALRELQAEGRLPCCCRQRTRRHSNNRIESDHRHIKRRLRAMQGPRTAATAWAVIQGIEATQMIRKGQELVITRRNLQAKLGFSAPYWVSHSRRSRTFPSCAIQFADATLPLKRIPYVPVAFPELPSR